MPKSSEIKRREFLRVGALSAAGLPSLAGRTALFAGSRADAKPEETAGAAMRKSGNGAVLKAGVAKVDIAPPLGLPMWGYAVSGRTAQGTLDPLYARVLALEAGDTRLALITLDLGRSFGETSLARLRKAVKQSSNVSCLIAAASHTHSGPVIETDYPNGTPAWETAALSKIAQAVDKAFGSLAQAQLCVGYGMVDIGYNRRRISSEGTALMLWSNTSKVPTAPVDPTATILRVNRADGSPLAVLVNYACHAVVFASDNRQYSADWPGVMTKTVEESMGNEPICFFLQGAAGDINPYYATTLLQHGAQELRAWTGQRIGEEVVRVAKEIRTHAEASPSIQFRDDVLSAHFRWNREAHRKASIEELGSGPTNTFAPDANPDIQLPVSTVLINREIAWMTMPGEPFVELQTTWRDQCPLPHSFFAGYSNEYRGYIPTLLAATQGGYGAADVMTYVEVGSGERMVNNALVRTYEMLGKLTDIPVGQLLSTKG